MLYCDKLAELYKSMQGGLGSLRPVSVQDCQVACEMAQPACASFAYNELMAACFLKRGGGRATCISPTSVCTEQVLPGCLRMRLAVSESFHACVHASAARMPCLGALLRFTSQARGLCSF